MHFSQYAKQPTFTKYVLALVTIANSLLLFSCTAAPKLLEGPYIFENPTNSGALVKLSITNNRILHTINLGFKPLTCSFTEDHRAIFCLSTSGEEVEEINALNFRTSKLKLPFRATDMLITAAGYVFFYGNNSNKIEYFNLSNPLDIASLEAPFSPVSIAYDSPANTLIIANQVNFQVINLSGQLIFPPAKTAAGIRFLYIPPNSDGLYVFEEKTVALYSLFDTSLISSFDLKSYPVSFALDTQNYIGIAPLGNAQFAVIDLIKNKVLNYVNLSFEPTSSVAGSSGLMGIYSSNSTSFESIRIKAIGLIDFREFQLQHPVSLLCLQ